MPAEGARLTVSAMVRRMPLEMFLRLVRGGLLMASEGFTMIIVDLSRASLKLLSCFDGVITILSDFSGICL